MYFFGMSEARYFLGLSLLWHNILQHLLLKAMPKGRV